MTSEDFVKNRFPAAHIERYLFGNHKAYYVCYLRGHKGRISEEKSRSNAWGKAKDNIVFIENYSAKLDES
jgi:hypothetical protein